MHNLTIRALDGQAEMFYVDETPWHGLGQKLDQVATSQEAIAAAHLDWSVGVRRMYIDPIEKLQAEGINRVHVPDWNATYREDTGEVLGVVGNRYRVIQIADSFKFMDDLVGEVSAMYHTAGSLRGGKRVFITAKLPDQLVITPEDALDKYLMLTNSFDGMTAMLLKFVVTRPVCENTVNAALMEGAGRDKNMRFKTVQDQQVAIWHTSNATKRVDDARKALGVSMKYFDRLQVAFQAMSAKQINSMMLTEYYNKMFPIIIEAEDGTKKESTRAKKVHQVLTRLFETGKGNDLATTRGTVWAAYNSVTEYLDHIRSIRADGTIKADWQENIMLGTGADIRQIAMNEAVQLVNA